MHGRGRQVSGVCNHPIPPRYGTVPWRSFLARVLLFLPSLPARKSGVKSASLAFGGPTLIFSHPERHSWYLQGWIGTRKQSRNYQLQPQCGSDYGSQLPDLQPTWQILPGKLLMSSTAAVEPLETPQAFDQNIYLHWHQQPRTLCFPPALCASSLKASRLKIRKSRYFHLNTKVGEGELGVGEKPVSQLKCRKSRTFLLLGKNQPYVLVNLQLINEAHLHYWGQSALLRVPN